jgi:hypothetical protein
MRRALAIGIAVVATSCTKPSPTQTRKVHYPLADDGDALGSPIDAGGSVSDAPPALPADAANPPRPAFVLSEGHGTCKRDSDCVTSNWQPGGCKCTHTCSAYAISKRELAAREKSDRCPKVQTTPCPPPAPCPAPTFWVHDAVCDRGHCAAQHEPIPARAPDSGL